ncbi:MAG TPA: response regulator [Patescibacteria group bacterium]|nr:response regulator [Patescibacteria group bacterium]
MIEPNRLLARTYTKALELVGHNVMWSNGAQQAVRIADGQKPDLVLLELQLVKHNGIAFLYEFRSYPDWQSVPVIIHSMVSPDNLQVNKEVYRRLGISAYLYKPQTSLKNLVSTIDQMFALSS